MSEMWAPNDSAQASSGAQLVIATSAVVLTTLRSAGSTVPGLGIAAAAALHILTLVQTAKDNNAGFVALANDACGLVYTLIIESRRIMNNGQRIPDHIQQHMSALSHNLSAIEAFTKKKMKRNSFRKMMSYSKDMADIARYREMLKQSLDIFGIQSNISIQEYLQQLMDQMQQQRAVIEAERRHRIDAERRAKEDQASQAEINRIQDEERLARIAEGIVRAQHAESEHAQEKKRRSRLKQSHAEELRLIQAENERLEREQEALRQQLGRSPSPYLPPNYPVPMNPYVSNPYSPYPAHLFPPQPLYPQTPGGISLQNVSGSNISINSPPPPLPPPVITNFNSGNVSNISISNVNNTNSKPRRKPKT